MNTPSIFRFLLALALPLCLPVGQAAAQGTGAVGSCSRAVIYDASTNGATQLVAAGNTIYICGYTFFAGGTVSVDLIYGTGTNCGTGTTKITPAYQLTTQTGIVDPSPFFRGMDVPSSNALCINTNAAVAVQAIVYYNANPL